MSQERRLSCIVLAAGQGTRMKSDIPKVLFTVCGRPIIGYVLDAASELCPERTVVVVGHGAEEVMDRVSDEWERRESGDLRFVVQQEQRGTAHAVMCARDALADFHGDVMVLNGDSTPLITGGVLKDFRDGHVRCGAGVSFITAMVDDPDSYGRVLRTSQGVVGIVEARDLSEDQAAIKEINSGIYLAEKDLLFDLLSGVKDDNAKREFYLTDIVGLAVQRGILVYGHVSKDPLQVQGINNRYELSQVEDLVRREMLRRLALDGVTVRDISSVYIDYGVEVGRDTVIEPQTYLRGKTRIGEGCVIGPGTEIRDSFVGDRTRIRFSVVEDAVVGRDVQIGPYSHIRPDTEIDEGVLVGNFAEIKNSRVGSGSKIHHHSYIGDTDMGGSVNIGAGTVTVNYDGMRKHRTVIEDGAFIGCNANLIAPVKVGKGAYVAAGSTITQEVPEGALAIAREYQVNKEGWVARRRGQGR